MISAQYLGRRVCGMGMLNLVILSLPHMVVLVQPVSIALFLSLSPLSKPDIATECLTGWTPNGGGWTIGAQPLNSCITVTAFFSYEMLFLSSHINILG